MSHNRLPRPDRETLYRWYVDEALTAAEIALRCSVATSTMHYWLVAAEVPMRPGAAQPHAEVADADIVRCYIDEGLSGPSVATRLGCSTSHVYFRLECLGIRRRTNDERRTPPLDAARLAQLYVEQGLGHRRVAKQLGVGPARVRSELDRAGLPIHGTGPIHPPVDAVADLYARGWSGPEIADRFDCSPKTIYTRLDAAGVTRRSPCRVSREDLGHVVEGRMTVQQLADRLEVSPSAVYASLAREDLRTPTQVARLERQLRQARRRAARG